MTIKYTIMRLPEVTKAIGLSRASLYAQINSGTFPKPINIGPRSVGWVTTEVEALLEARIKNSNDYEIKHLVQDMYKKRTTANVQ